MLHNSLPAPSLPEQTLSVANESYSCHKNQQNSTPPTSTDQQSTVSSLNKKPANHSGRTYHSKWLQNYPWFQFQKGRWQFPFMVVKMSVKKCPKIFQMSEQFWGCLDKMSEVIFSPAETLCILGHCLNFGQC